jgi:hypothetical protein
MCRERLTTERRERNYGNNDQNVQNQQNTVNTNFNNTKDFSRRETPIKDLKQNKVDIQKTVEDVDIINTQDPKEEIERNVTLMGQITQDPIQEKIHKQKRLLELKEEFAELRLLRKIMGEPSTLNHKNLEFHTST